MINDVFDDRYRMAREISYTQSAFLSFESHRNGSLTKRRRSNATEIDKND